MEAAHGLRCVWPQRVAKCQQADKRAVACNGNDRQPLRFELANASILTREIHFLRFQKRRTADHQLGVTKTRPDALTRHRLESLRLGQSDTAFERLFHYRPGEGMFGARLYGCCERE